MKPFRPQDKRVQFEIVFRRKSFSLIELLITIAIIAILAGILLPALNSARKKAISINCISNLKNTGMIMNLYADAFDDWLVPPRGAGDESNTQWTTILCEFNTRAKVTGYLTAENTKALQIFHCPGINFMEPGGEVKGIVYQTYGLNYRLYGGVPESMRKALKRSQAGRLESGDVDTVPYARPSDTVMFADTLRFRNGQFGGCYFIFGADFSFAGAIHSRAKVNVCMLDGSARTSSVSELRTKSSFKNSYGSIYDISGAWY